MNMGGKLEQPYWKTNVIGLPGQPHPSDAEVVVDEVLHDSATTSFIKMSVGGLVAQGIIQRTSHIEGNMPAGGNELFEDGHVEWRPWRVMWNNGNPQNYFGSNPVFIY
jgi:hypothetical protein